MKGYEHAQEIDPKEFFRIECDICIPAALGNQITEENAGMIKASVIAEGANGPIDTAGEEILLDKGVHIIP